MGGKVGQLGCPGGKEEGASSGGAMRTDAFDRASELRADHQAMQRSLVTVTKAIGD